VERYEKRLSVILYRRKKGNREEMRGHFQTVRVGEWNLHKETGKRETKTRTIMGWLFQRIFSVIG
jgi:hypothetical protein